MKKIIRILVAIALLVTVAALLVTSIGTHPLHSSMLMAHMFASGAFVFVLPLFAIAWLWRMVDTANRGGWVRAGYWLLLVTGFVTTGTMFLSMLPIASTDHLKKLISIHGYAGFAMVAAAVVFAIGWICTNRRPAAGVSPDASR